MRISLTALVAAGLVAASACGGGGESLDGDGGGSAQATCFELADQLRDLAENQIADVCSVRSDCTAVGYPVDFANFPTCNCGVTFANSCGGIAVNASAWQLDARVAPLLEAWNTRCVAGGDPRGAPDLCDCSWEPSSIDCVNSRCYTDWRGRSCFPPAGDASVD